MHQRIQRHQGAGYELEARPAHICHQRTGDRRIKAHSPESVLELCSIRPGRVHHLDIAHRDASRSLAVQVLEVLSFSRGAHDDGQCPTCARGCICTYPSSPPPMTCRSNSFPPVTSRPHPSRHVQDQRPRLPISQFTSDLHFPIVLDLRDAGNARNAPERPVHLA